MIIKKVAGMNGEVITLMTPETQADIEELERMEAQGILDTRESFADDPEACAEVAKMVAARAKSNNKSA